MVAYAKEKLLNVEQVLWKYLNYFGTIISKDSTQIEPNIKYILILLTNVYLSFFQRVTTGQIEGIFCIDILYGRE